MDGVRDGRGDGEESGGRLEEVVRELEKRGFKKETGTWESDR